MAKAEKRQHNIRIPLQRKYKQYPLLEKNLLIKLEIVSSSR